MDKVNKHFSINQDWSQSLVGDLNIQSGVKQAFSAKLSKGRTKLYILDNENNMLSITKDGKIEETINLGADQIDKVKPMTSMLAL